MKRNLSLQNNKNLILIIILLLISNKIKSLDNYNISFLGNKQYNGMQLGSIWGYTDTIHGKEYALVGASKGLSIVDITNAPSLQQVTFDTTSNTIWHEIKTYKNYAYMVHDGNNSRNEGLVIVDLSYLPDSTKRYNFKGNGSNITLTTQHTIFIDENGFLYLNGGGVVVNGTTVNGTAIFDLNPNPLHPLYVGKASIRYVHDCYVRNNVLYQAHSNSPNSNKFSIWNIQDKTNPVLLLDFSTTYSITHNIWLSDDSKSMFVTHESSGQPIEVYDITDVNNLKQLLTFKNTPNEIAIAHNVHVYNDYLVVPYYTRGLVVFDASVPDNVVRIGYYDTSPSYTESPSDPFHGAWGAYPYFKDGKVIVSDIESGLHVLQPTYVRAARMQGIVTDTNTTLPITGVKISFVDSTMSANTNFLGFYKTGTAKAGLTRFKAEKTGYITKYFSVNLANGRTDTINIQLRQIPIQVRQTASFCQNRTYTLPDGRVVSEPGIYTTDFVLPSGKDSIITTTLSQINATFIAKSASICEGESYTLPHGNTTTVAGVFIDTFSNSVGCDSIITSTVTVNPVYTIFKEDTIYKNDVYTLPNGSTTSASGTYVNNLSTVSFHCDSVITVHLTVLDTSTLSGIQQLTNRPVKFILNGTALTIMNHSGSRMDKLEIYNSIGMLVKEFTNPENNLLLPVLPKDIYLIRGITLRNEQYTQKVVIY